MQGISLEWLVALRRDLHACAEPGFSEWRTQARLQAALKEIGVPDSDIRVCAETGLCVDLRGEALPNGVNCVVACRAELDGLPGDESDSTLSYRSLTGYSHLCGHDGHMTALVGLAKLFRERRLATPSNHTLRLLFQPAEEMGRGAAALVAAGVLDGVKEVWALHNQPFNPSGVCVAHAGRMTSGCETLRIELRGRGGHPALDSNLRDPVVPLCGLLYEVSLSLPSTTFYAPQLSTSSAANIMPDVASAVGKLRYTSHEDWVENRRLINTKMLEFAKKHNLEGTVTSLSNTLPIINSRELVAVLEEVTGFLEVEGLPLNVSEDFGHFSAAVPACYFIYRTGHRLAEVHQAGYDFNDLVLQDIVSLWLRIILHRLG